jgi:hypothetical protein
VIIVGNGEICSALMSYYDNKEVAAYLGESLNVYATAGNCRHVLLCATAPSKASL